MTTQSYLIGNLDCPGCASEVEAGVCQLAGVTSAEVDYFSGKLRLTGDVAFDVLRERIEALGKTIALPDEMPTVDTSNAPGGVRGFWDYLLTRHETVLALFGGATITATLIAEWLGMPATVANILYTIGMAVALWPIAASGLDGLRVSRQFNIDLLMSIAAVGAIAIGEYFEGALVIFLFATGEALERYTSQRTRNSIQSLITLTPRHALRLTGDREESVPVEQLHIGDRILVKPGANIPMDGRVLSGASTVNQAPITGESIPVAKSQDDDLFAGTINGEGTLTVEVTRRAADNTLQRIIAMVEEAQSKRAPSQRIIDRFANRYTPAVVIMAAAVAIVPPLLFGAPFFDPAPGAGEGHGWLYRALAMLVIACPCALVISTPVTIMNAIAHAARRGVLIKGGAFLEMLGQVRGIAFDKTGTLTVGKPVVTTYQAVDCQSDLSGTSPDRDGSCVRCADLLALAAAVERRTTHPLADAVVFAAQERGLAGVYQAADDVELLAGHGVRGQIDESMVTVGSHALFDAQFPHSDALCMDIHTLEKSGQTTMLLAKGGAVRGYIALTDEPRPTAQSVIADLNKLGLVTIMLSGDHAQAAEAVAQQIDVKDVRAGLLPAEKVDAVAELQEVYQHVAMVGDGVNDTPALAAASVGVAMGGAGSPQALETADVVLMADDLTQLPFAVRLSRRARRLIRQNVALSFCVKIGFLALALFGLTSLWFAILADVGMTLLVTFNGMRAGNVD